MKTEKVIVFRKPWFLRYWMENTVICVPFICSYDLQYFLNQFLGRKRTGHLSFLHLDLITQCFPRWNDYSDYIILGVVIYTGRFGGHWFLCLMRIILQGYNLKETIFPTFKYSKLVIFVQFISYYQSKLWKGGDKINVLHFARWNWTVALHNHQRSINHIKSNFTQSKKSVTQDFVIEHSYRQSFLLCLITLYNNTLLQQIGASGLCLHFS